MRDQLAPDPTFRRLKVWQWAALALLLGLGIGAWRYEIIDSPPYWDFAIGLWTEANFLAETGFDYALLWYDEKPIRDGGAHCYITSVMPTLLALAMGTGSPRSVIIGYHVFTFACTAVVLCQVLALLRPQLSWTTASLVTLAIVTTPLFNVQVDMLGMELPLAVCALATTQFVLGGRYGLAALASTAGFLIKATGVVITTATLAYLTLRWIVRDETDRRELLWGLACNLAALALQLVIVKWGGHIDSQLVPGHRSGAIGLLSTPYWSPDLVILAGLVTAASIWQFGSWWRHATASAWWPRVTSTIARCLREMPLATYSWIVVVGTCLAITRIILLPRYLMITIPFLYFILVTLAVRHPLPRFGLKPVLAVVIVLNLLSLDGRFLLPIPEVLERQFGVDGGLFARTGGLLERSREYLVDHQANVAAMRAIEAEAGSAPIVAGGPFAHFLALPRLGYVSRQLRGYAVNGFSDLISQFRDVTPGLLEERPQDALFVVVGSTFYHHSNRFEMPQYEAGDELLFDDEQEFPLQVFRKTWGGNPPEAAELTHWYLKRAWPRASPVDRAQYLAAFRGKNGDLTGALAEIDAALVDLPQHPRLERARAYLALQLGQIEEAVASAVAAVRSPLDDAPVFGDIVYADSEWYKSRARAGWQEFERAYPLARVPIEGDSAEASQTLGVGLERLLAGDLEGAQSSLDQACVDAPQLAPAALAAAYLALELGDAQGALQRVAALSTDQIQPAMWSVTGRAHETLGAWAEAAHAYDRALEQDADDVAVLRARARVAFRQKDPRTARRMLERVLTILPADEEANRLLSHAEAALPRG